MWLPHAVRPHLHVQRGTAWLSCTLRCAAELDKLLALTTGLAVCRVRVVGLDVTHQCFLRANQIEQLPGQGALGQFLHQISQFYLAYHK